MQILFRINQRKKEAMQCYTNSLNKSPPNTHRVQKCLQKLLRSMHKDRWSALAVINKKILQQNWNLYFLLSLKLKKNKNGKLYRSLSTSMNCTLQWHISILHPPILVIHFSLFCQTSHHPALQSPPGDQHGAGGQGEGDHHRAPRWYRQVRTATVETNNRTLLWILLQFLITRSRLTSNQ